MLKYFKTIKNNKRYIKNYFSSSSTFSEYENEHYHYHISLHCHIKPINQGCVWKK